MTIQYDEKGKIFTKVVSKIPVQVIVQTATHQIHGSVHVRPDERLKDELDRADQFIAVTDAEIVDQQGQVILKTGFLSINRDHISWIIPSEELQSS